MASIGMLFNILLNFFLIPRYYALGAVWASLITQFSTAIAQIIMSSKILQFNTNYTFIVKIIVFLVLSFIITFLSKTILPDNVLWIIKAALSLTICTAISILLKIIDIGAAFSFLKYSTKKPK
jgi:O-antigen/teichoic acid export membrane protein